MRAAIKTAIRAANVIAVVLCVWWYVREPGFEPIVTGILVLAGLLIPLEGQAAPRAALEASDASALYKPEGLQFSDIRAEIQDAPPFHQEEVASRYIGQTISWNMFLWNVTPTPDGKLTVVLDFGSHTTQLVYCVVQQADYREITLMRRGEPVSVSGVIAEISSQTATISDAKLGYSAKQQADG